ncbi:MAG: PepSY-associated TM helix domain-containing protein, partial [Burkholderiaceae bacterium]
MAYSRTATPAGSSATVAPTSAWTQLIVRLHFYIGLFVGPFIFVAALTGTLFVITPQLENMIYAQALRTDSTGTPRPLSAQVQAAMDALDSQTTPYAVRPARGD